MAKVTGIRLARKGGGGGRFRSDNLRAAPSWVTPELVGRILSLAITADVSAVPIKTVPTRGEKPKLAVVPIKNPPVARTHSRRTEREAAPSGPTATASPRNSSTPAAADAETPPSARQAATASESGTAFAPGDAVPAPKATTETRQAWQKRYGDERREKRDAQVEADRPAFQVAFDRGISIADLARCLGQNEGTVSLHTRHAGFRFGRREQLADRITLNQLMALADPAVPLPELRSVRLKRERLAKWSKHKRDKRADDVARRRADRQAAAEKRRKEQEEAKAEARRQREIERARLAAAKAKPKPKIICEVEKAPARQAGVPAPSREPALHAPGQARAQPIPVGQTPGAPNYIRYAERVTGAIAYLRGRNFTVQRHSRDEIIARWHVSGYVGLFSNEQLVELAVFKGLEFAA